MAIQTVFILVTLVFNILQSTIVAGGLPKPTGYHPPICPSKPGGISSFRPNVGTRLYYAWSTIQGSAKKAFLSNTLCRGGDITECSCIGYDVTGYDKYEAETQFGITFSVNKRLGVGDLYRFRRPWYRASPGVHYLECHYDRDYQYGAGLKTYSDYKNPVSFAWTQKNVTEKTINVLSSKLKVLSWTATEVVFYDCSSVDPDIRIYTTYQPKADTTIPYSVFDVLTQVGIDINALHWLRLDHKNCNYPNFRSYAGLTKTQYSTPVLKY